MEWKDMSYKDKAQTAMYAIIALAAILLAGIMLGEGIF
jgi:hypothetical protein